jgi:hypothetical protein
MLEHLYQQFMDALLQHEACTSVSCRDYAGQRFYYVTSPLAVDRLQAEVEQIAIRIVRHTMCGFAYQHVRQEGAEIVFRFRFTVPNQKMFCCGNLCEDCTRLNP